MISVLAFIRCLISTPSASAIPLSSVRPVVRPPFSSPSIIPAVTPPVTPVFLCCFLLPVGVSPLPLPLSLLFPLSVFLPLPVALSVAFTKLQRLSTGAGLRPALSAVLHVSVVSVLTRVSGRFPSPLADVPSVSGLSGFSLVTSVP